MPYYRCRTNWTLRDKEECKIILDQEVTIKLSNNIRGHYKNLGYPTDGVGRDGDLVVRARDLPPTSREVLKVKCDYCGEITERRLIAITRGREFIEKDCCDSSECKVKKTQDCSSCQERTGPKNDLTIRTWVCSNCHTKHDRDINAGKNILNKGLQLVG